ncbi:MAG TPA: hypothetical protein VFJ13_10960 [Paracoccaceae bacterium]|nr:hypothetical protein [Paracoccaceae bacterium]
MFRWPALMVAALALAACGSPAPYGPAGQTSTDSPIAGETLRCRADYPDSRLVFRPDGTLDGRFAGREVSGRWHAPAPDRVEVVIRAGGITIRDTIRRTATGWRGEETLCG